jgi:phosphomevalonate kinase
MAEAHAPGKLLLCGEYAVLHGAPGLAVAADVRARASVTAVRGPCRLLLPGEGAYGFDWSDEGAPRWRESPPAGGVALVAAVAAALAAGGVVCRQAVEVSLDSRAFRGTGGRKLGLGSSAAVTVALLAGLQAAAGRGVADRATLAPLCLDAHRRLQQGRGSGIDVAVALHGGVVTLDSTQARDPIRVLAWPAGLHALAAWTGESASTPALVERFERFVGAEPARWARCLADLRRIAREALAAWERADVAVILRAFSDYDDALRALDDGADIGIYTGSHARLACDAQAAGAAYKVSGAGGGDFGIACADSAATLGALAARWSAEGVLTLRLDGGVPGLVVAA